MTLAVARVRVFDYCAYLYDVLDRATKLLSISGFWHAGARRKGCEFYPSALNASSMRTTYLTVLGATIVSASPLMSPSQSTSMVEDVSLD